MSIRENARKPGMKKWITTLLLCSAGIAINFLGAQLALRLHLPLYLDCIGIIAVSAVGGYIPGIAVGFFTNVINGLSDSMTIYYSLTSVLIAIWAAECARRGFLRRFPQILAAIGGFVLIGGGIGSVLTWMLYGGGIGEGISATMAHAIYDQGVLGMFLSQLLADLLVDIPDKILSTLAAVALVSVLPASVRDQYPEMRRSAAAKKEWQPRTISLRAKVLAFIAAAAIIVTVAVTWISLRLYHTSIINEESRMATGVAHTAAAAFDADRVQEYLDLGEAAPGYRESDGILASVAESAEEIAYVYVYKILPDGCHVVFDPDTSAGAGSEPGEVIPFDQAFMPLVPDLLAGREIEPVISNETYGYLLSVYLPVLDSAGDCQCYVGVDILMQRLKADEYVFLTKVVTLFLSFFILILALGAWAADRSILKPINDMAAASSSFAANIESDRRSECLQCIQRLDIRTGDEIENLYHAVRSTTQHTVQYINDVQTKNEQISQMQSGLIMVLADLVESRDKCTGDHIRNTAIYARMILERMREDGMYPEILTEDYIMDMLSSAPLHDVGKIHIPDAILNKPGPLDDEEFALMKQHTTIGGDIIDRAVRMMPMKSAQYLTEAKNVTLYHHERWDGKGYPAGLAGEEIPLSARVMAVADVFDALVSRRSYKAGFPFEKAMEIIREESGTHFDPQVVRAFVECSEQARRVAEEANAKRGEEA